MISSRCSTSATKPKPRSAPRIAAGAMLAARFGDRFSRAEAVRRQHGHNFTWYDNQPPDAVVFATRATTCRTSCANARPIACRSFRSAPARRSRASSTRRSAASRSTSRRMDAILAVKPQDLDCTVQPGVTRTQAQQLHPRPGPVLPDRSRRRRQPWRHGRNPRLGHQRGALRHDERRRAVARPR